MQLNISQQKLVIGVTKTNRYISFESDDFEDILDLHESMKGFYNPRFSCDSAFGDVEHHSFTEDDEHFINEGLAEWVITDIDKIKATSGDDDNDDGDDNLELWSGQFLRSFIVRKSCKKKKENKDDTPKSRFYVSTPTTTTLQSE